MMKKIAIFIFCCNAALAQQDSNRNFHAGFIYPLSSNGQCAQNYSNKLSFHVLAGVSANERAFCFSGIATVVREQADGLIFSGVTNYIGHDAYGMQFAGITNIIGGQSGGFQFAGFSNIARKSVHGLQVAGFSNIIKDSSKGLQLAGFSNIAGHATDQVAGFSNISRSTAAVQVAGFSNISKEINGLQLAGFSNIATTVKGSQVAGFINIAQKVSGVQAAGFINIADSSDYPIGLVNIIRNGEQYLGISVEETKTTMVSLRSGSKKVYGILGIGMNAAHAELRYGMEGGIGMHVPLSFLFRIKTEFALLSLTDFRDGVLMKSTVHIMPSMKLGRSFELFAGPGFSFINSPQHLSTTGMEYLWSRQSKGTFYGMSIGAVAGLQLRL